MLVLLFFFHCSRRSRSASGARSGSTTYTTASDRHADDRILRKVDNENNAVYEQSEKVSDVRHFVVRFI